MTDTKPSPSTRTQFRPESSPPIRQAQLESPPTMQQGVSPLDCTICGFFDTINPPTIATEARRGPEEYGLKDPFSILVTDKESLPVQNTMGEPYYKFIIYDVMNPHRNIYLIVDEGLNIFLFTSVNLDAPGIPFDFSALSALKKESRVLVPDYDPDDPRKIEIQRSLGLLREDQAAELDQASRKKPRRYQPIIPIMGLLGITVVACTGPIYPPRDTKPTNLPVSPLPDHTIGVLEPTGTPPAPPMDPTPKIESTIAPTRTPTPLPIFEAQGETFDVVQFAQFTGTNQDRLLSRMTMEKKADLAVSLMGIISQLEFEKKDTLTYKRSFLNILFETRHVDIWKTDINDPNNTIHLALKPEWGNLDFRIALYRNYDDITYSILYCEESMFDGLNNGVVISNRNLEIVRPSKIYMNYENSAVGYAVSPVNVERIKSAVKNMNQYLPTKSRHHTVHFDGSPGATHPGGKNDLVYSKLTVYTSSFEKSDSEGNRIPPEITAYITTHEVAHTIYTNIFFGTYRHVSHEEYIKYFENFTELEMEDDNQMAKLFREGSYIGYEAAGHPEESPSELFASLSSLFLTGDIENRYQNQRSFVTNATSKSFNLDQIKSIRNATRFVINFYAKHPNAPQNLFCPEVWEFVEAQ